MATSTTSKGNEDLKMELTVFTYGPDQRRTEIELRPTIPASIRGDPPKINAWIHAYSMIIAKDIKHTAEWDCEICGKPARESKYNVTVWPHIEQPRTVFYIHNLCESGMNPCHLMIKEQEATMARMTGTGLSSGPMPPGLDLEPAREVYPLASSCAYCHDEKTAKKDFRMSRCGGCKLTRYCCPGCQRADWKRHKEACKIVKSVKWVHWPTPASSN